VKILNLFAGIGGNRLYWSGEITAVENNEEIAKIYQELFPNDEVIITDAYEYVLKNFQEYDFIWASPPCPTHSQTNYFLFAQGKRRFPDMNLWKLIIFFQSFVSKYSNINWVVENVKPYYDPLIQPSFILGRHYYWSNYTVLSNKYNPSQIDLLDCHSTRNKGKGLPRQEQKDLEEYLGIKLPKNNSFTRYEARQVLRNCVHPKEALFIFQNQKRQKNVLNFFNQEQIIKDEI
jgi:DNA (cytosine-5)-methyltransferase 1